MSSSSSSSPTSDFSALPSIGATTDADPDSVTGGGVTRGASYFFGFLVTFIVLLLLFLGCALASRRRLVARRRALLIGRGDPWVFGYRGPADGEEVRHVKPVWVERWIDFEKAGAEGWAGIMPLSTTITRPDTKTEHENEHESENKKTGRGSPTSTSTTTSSPRRASFFSVSSWLSMNSTSKEPLQGLAPTQATPPIDSNAEAYITIMVAMPLDPKTHGPSVYEFGVARVPLASWGG